MSEIATAATGSSFALLDCRTGEAVRGLLDHTIDFAIVRKSAIVQPLKFRALGRFGYALFMPKAIGTKPTKEDLPLAVAMGGDFFDSLQRAAGKADKSMNVVFRCTNFSQAAQLVRSGACGAILPRIAAPFLVRDAAVRELPWLKTVTRDIGIAWHRRLMEVRPHAGMILDAMAKPLGEALKKS